MGHIPVLLNEVMEYLRPVKGETIVDATLGGGGHSEEILKKIAPGGRLVAIDRDERAVEMARVRFKDLGKEVIIRSANFADIEKVLTEEGIEMIDGAIFDLGFSSYQLDDPRRGFSFMKDGPLDMRYDTNGKLSARDLVNGLSEKELQDLIREYGEERYAYRVARSICEARKRKKIETTLELASIIEGAIGKMYRGQRLSSPVRTFQAIRIATNRELEAIEGGVRAAMRKLKSGGRISVISFHSLEDRMIKNIFRENKMRGEFEVLTKKPVCPDMREIENNPRSRSAKLRTCKKI
ncbi:MAG: 16S rRNA (cytosine(1402)-N(4))-methyltransferase RsmH [Candidatus Omnitrophica bacterium]|nr:16S rRNA (cytosine(1402)-N(4))-methyltransferase RsmH [Candidatus Omnitrophota bacterium]